GVLLETLLLEREGGRPVLAAPRRFPRRSNGIDEALTRTCDRRRDLGRHGPEERRREPVGRSREESRHAPEGPGRHVETEWARDPCARPARGSDRARRAPRPRPGTSRRAPSA